MPIGQNMYGQNYGYQQPFVGQNNQMNGFQNGMNQSGVMNMSSQPGLSIVSINSDDNQFQNQVSNYPVASGNTVAFINFNTNRLCFKTTNQNGVTMPQQWATFTYDAQQPQSQQNFCGQNQNTNNYVSREEFDELRSMLQQTLNAVQNQNQDSRQQRYNPKKQGGYKDDRPANVSGGNE